MNAEIILADLLNSGITPEVTPDGAGIKVPAGRLTAAQRAAIMANKAELLLCIQESARITSELLTAAMRACDHWKDSPVAREEMRRQCLELTPTERAAWLAHFNRSYPP